MTMPSFKRLHLIRTLSQPWYTFMAVVFAIGILLVYVYSQVLGNVQNVDVWVANLSETRAAMLIVFGILFGITLSYQISLWMGKRACPIHRQAKGTGASGLSTIGIFLVAQCPACASLGALFLPLSVVTLLGQYAEWLNIASILLMLFTLHYLGAFETSKTK